MQLFVPRKGGYYFYSLSINSLTLLNIDRKSRVVAIYDKESMNLFFGKDDNHEFICNLDPCINFNPLLFTIIRFSSERIVKLPSELTVTTELF